jgi:hypothetical protein
MARVRVLKTIPALAAVAFVVVSCGDAEPVPQAVGTTLQPTVTGVSEPLAAQTDVFTDPVTFVEPPPEAEAVAKEWIAASMTRDDLARSWDLLAEVWRAKYTREEWLTGVIPVVPLPETWRLQDFEKVTAFERDFPTEELVIRYRIGGPVTGTEQRFDWEWFIELVEEAGSWRVAFYTPITRPTLGVG